MADRGQRQAFLDRYDRVMAKWPVPVEPLELPSRFGTTYVNACGPADAPPLVLLHGGGATSAVWFANVGELSRIRRVYAVDRITETGRGRYDGDKVAGLADLMEWLDTTLDGLGVASADLAGHSYGAWTALRYALHAPARVSRLALLDPTKCFAGQTVSYALRGGTAMFGSPERMKAFLRWESGGRHIDPDWVELMSAPTGARTSLVWPRRPAEAELRGLRTPLLVLVAGASRQHDPVALAAGARRLVPGARVVTLPGASHHTMPTEDAAAINASLVDFLTGADGPADAA